MRTFWKGFWASLGSLSALVGLYFAADAANLVEAFWWVLAAAIASGLAFSLGPKAKVWFGVIRDHPRLLRAAAELQSENERLKRAEDSRVSDLEEKFTDGVAEGRAQVLGAMKAQTVSTMPELVASMVDGNGEPVLIGAWSGDQVALGARFEVAVTATGIVKGLVEATHYDEARGVVALRCVAPTSPGFWQQLAARSELDSGPPPGVTLRRAPVELSPSPDALGIASASEPQEESE